MIRIDRSSPLPVHTQLLDQLRYELAGGRYRVGEMLPSTRELARQLDVSFHTVRKAYQQLEREGILESRPGAGYFVSERGPVRHEDRMERGASIAHDALKRLLSLGLSDADIDYLFDEQRSLLESPAADHKIVVAAPFQEMAERCVAQLDEFLQIDAEPSTVSGLHEHSDADHIVVPYRNVSSAMQAVPGADILGVAVTLPVDVLEAVARLGSQSTAAVVVRDNDAVQPLMQEVRSATGYSGQMIGLSIEEKPEEIALRLRGADLVMATPSCSRRLRSRLGAGVRVLPADPMITEPSMNRMRSVLPH